MFFQHLFLSSILFFSLPAFALDNIYVTKFAGFADGKDGVMSGFVRDHGFWRSTQAAVLLDSEKFKENPLAGNLFSCNDAMDSYYEQAQLYALSKFLKSKYLTHDEVKEYLKNSLNFTNRPMSFYQYVTSEKPDPSAKAFDGPRTVKNVVAHFEPLPGMKITVKGQEESYDEYYMKLGATSPLYVNDPEVLTDGYVVASLYSVAGQRLEQQANDINPRLVMLDLPWTQDPEFKEAADYLFNRQNYPFVYEIGRAASDHRTGFAPLMAMAGAGIASEVMHYGMPNADVIAKTFVTFHALDEDRTEKFIKLFGEKDKSYIFLRAKSNPHNTVFVVPLARFLEKFPPDRYLQSHQLMKRGSETTKNIMQDQAFFELVKFAQYRYLDVIYKGQNLKTPLIFNSLPSGYLGIPVESIGERMGYSPTEIASFVQAMKNNPRALRVQMDIPWPESLLDPSCANAFESIPQLKDEHAFQIANLNPDLAKNNPEFIAINLVAAFDEYTRHFNPQNDLKVLQDLGANLKHNNIKFMLTTEYPETAAAIRMLQMPFHMNTEFTLDLKDDIHSKVVWDQITRLSDGKRQRPSTTMHAFLFDIDQISKIRDFIYRSYNSDPAKLAIAHPLYYWWLQGSSEP
jgi:hypothetical protein